jgi:hypothetical protein
VTSSSGIWCLAGIGDLITYPGWPELRSLTDAEFHTTQNLAQCKMGNFEPKLPGMDLRFSGSSPVAHSSDRRSA